MIPLPRLWVLLVSAGLGLIALPMAFSMAGAPFENPGNLVILVVALEFVLYFVPALVANPRMTFGLISVIALSMMIVRAFACVVGSLLGAAFLGEAHSGILTLWVGNPVSVIPQVLLLLIASPHLIAEGIPELIGNELRERLGAPAVEGRKAGESAPHEASPTGGFIQVFSFDELAATVRKSPGLEGFVIYGTDGLVVWRDMPMQLELDSLVARVMGLSGQMGAAVEGAGLTRTRKIVIESREHLLFNTGLNQNFGLLLIFSSRISPSECLSRIAVIAKTAREFLQWKYPVLPLSPGSPQAQMALDMMQ